VNEQRETLRLKRRTLTPEEDEAIAAEIRELMKRQDDESEAIAAALSSLDL